MESTSSDRAARQHPALRILGGFDRGLEWLETVIIGGGILVMAVIMAAHVGGRLFFGVGVPGTYEITEIIIILITFVGLSYGVRKARHISMSALYDQLTGRWRKGLLVTITLVTGALMFYLAWEALGYVLEIYQRGRQTSALQLKLWIVYMVLPIGFTLAGIQYWLTALRNLTTAGMWRSFTEPEAYAEVPDGE